MLALLFATAVTSDEMPATVVILAEIGDNVDMSVLIAAKLVTAELIPATVVTLAEIPAKVFTLVMELATD